VVVVVVGVGVVEDEGGADVGGLVVGAEVVEAGEDVLLVVEVAPAVAVVPLMFGKTGFARQSYNYAISDKSGAPDLRKDLFFEGLKGRGFNIYQCLLSFMPAIFLSSFSSELNCSLVILQSSPRSFLI
jgi:hypothetical protein